MVIMGLGTGRSGTHSFSKLMNKYNINLTHEKSGFVWEFDENKLNRYVRKLKNKETDGDIAFFNINYIEPLFKEFPDMKVVVLKRQKERVVRSFLGRWGHKGFLRPGNGGNLLFPNYDLSKEEALPLYYDDYYKKIDKLMEKYPNNIKLYTMDAFNDKETQIDMLKFIGIENPDVNLNIRLDRSNKSDGELD